MRDPGRLVVADHRRERRDQHEGAGHVLVDPLEVRLRALDQELAEVRAPVRQDRDRMHDVEDHQRLVDVHLQVAAGAAEPHRDVVRHHLHGDHRQCFGLGRVDLAGHDRGTGLVLGNPQLREARAGSARHQADVVADLVERDSERAECTGELHEGVVRALDGKLVRCPDERQLRELRDLGRRRLGEAGRRVDAGADGGAPEREAIHAVQGVVDPLQVVGEHAAVAGPLLPEGDRRRVLHVGPADLDDVRPLVRLRRDRALERLHREDEPLLDVDRGRDVHGRRERVVGRLGHVDVIVGVNRRLAAELCTGELTAPVRDDLVHVHVELRAAAGHPDVQREHVVMAAGEDLVARLNDELVGPGVESPARVVRVRGRLLQRCVRGDHLARDQVLPDAEVLQ